MSINCERFKKVPTIMLVLVVMILQAVLPITLFVSKIPNYKVFSIVSFVIGLFLWPLVICRFKKVEKDENKLLKIINSIERIDQTLRDSKLQISAPTAVESGRNCINAPSIGAYKKGTQGAFNDILKQLGDQVDNFVKTFNDILDRPECQRSPCKFSPRVMDILKGEGDNSLKSLLEKYGYIISQVVFKNDIVSSGKMTLRTDNTYNGTVEYNGTTIPFINGTDGPIYACYDFCTANNPSFSGNTNGKAPFTGEGDSNWIEDERMCKCPENYMITKDASGLVKCVSVDDKEINRLMLNAYTNINNVPDVPVIIPIVSGTCGTYRADDVKAFATC